MKKAVFGLAILCALALGGCGRIHYPALPEDALVFELGTFEDTEHDGASFGSIEYGGRTYIGFGTTNDLYRQGTVDRCVGYIVQDKHSASAADPADTNRRVYTLAGDEAHDFLLEYDDTIVLMNQPSFFRAVDTKGKDIKIPPYINDIEYEFWKETAR